MQSVSRFLWGPTPQEKVRKWQQQLKKEQRALDREIHALDVAGNKVKADVKRLAQKGDTKNAKLLAREVVRSNRQKQRMLTSKAQLNSINMQLGHQLGASSLSLFVPFASHNSTDSKTCPARSHGQGDGHAPGVDRHHEGVQRPRPASSTRRHDAGNERRDDEGASPSLPLSLLPSHAQS